VNSFVLEGKLSVSSLPSPGGGLSPAGVAAQVRYLNGVLMNGIPGKGEGYAGKDHPFPSLDPLPEYSGS
jgi:hypothetical protein